MLDKKFFLILLMPVSVIAQTVQIHEIVVAQDGSGDFRSIQDAIDATKAFPDYNITIFLKNGFYKEKVKVHAWNPRLSIIGESKDSTIISWDDYFDKINRGRNSTFHTYTLLVEANDFYAGNLTIENTSGEVGQAVALHIDADRVIFQDCKLKSNQDTVYLAGEGNRNYFRNCDIEGTTDFIFGAATALFEDCQIVSKKNSYITAASTPEGIPFGFVFNRCTLSATENASKVYLGRPWRNFAKTVFMNSFLGDHILPEGWDNWGREKAKATVFYSEYNNTGPGFLPENRVEWAYLMNEVEAKKYNVTNIFEGWQADQISKEYKNYNLSNN